MNEIFCALLFWSAQPALGALLQGTSAGCGSEHKSPSMWSRELAQHCAASPQRDPVFQSQFPAKTVRMFEAKHAYARCSTPPSGSNIPYYWLGMQLIFDYGDLSTLDAGLGDRGSQRQYAANQSCKKVAKRYAHNKNQKSH